VETISASALACANAALAPWITLAPTSSPELSARPPSAVAPAEQIAAAAADEQQRAERQRVPVHDPCDPADAEPQAVLDRGERDVDDRHVEHDHQLRGCEQQQRNGGARHGSFAVGF
jgi:hypothetical protein